MYSRLRPDFDVSGSEGLSKIGPQLPSCQDKSRWSNTQFRINPKRIEFVYQEHIIDGADRNSPALVASLTRKDIRRLCHVSQWILTLETGRPLVEWLPGHDKYPQTSFESFRSSIHLGAPDKDLFLSISVPDWTHRGLSLEFKRSLLPFVAYLQAVYGCIHWLAEKFLFPSEIEHLLWKLSCLLFMISGVGSCILFFIPQINLIAVNALHGSRNRTRMSNNQDIEIGEFRPPIYVDPPRSFARDFRSGLDSLPLSLGKVIKSFGFHLPLFLFVSYIVLLGYTWFWSLSFLCVMFQLGCTERQVGIS
jgi:hypothetical protein